MVYPGLVSSSKGDHCPFSLSKGGHLSPFLAFLTRSVVQFPCIHQDRRKSRSLDNDIPHRSWQVLLLGGPSGVGKTSVSYQLAHHFRIGITEVDDFQVILERMTTPTEQPVLHYWHTHPEAGNQPAEEIVKHTIAVGQVMAPALEMVIADHIQSRAPLVLEGNYILPMLATSFFFRKLDPEPGTNALPV